MNDKLGFSAGIINLILGMFLLADAVFFGITAFASLLLSATLFFMAAIPLFLLLGSICLLTLAATAANIITGTGTIVASIKGGTASKVFSTGSVILDGLVIPPNVFAVSYLIYVLISNIIENNSENIAFLIFIIIFGTLTVALTATSFIIHLTKLSSRKSKKIIERTPQSTGGRI